MKPIGIMSALLEETHTLFGEFSAPIQETQAGMRVYQTGTLWTKPAVLVYSRIGKVAAASTATTLINTFGVNQIVFTGVAGAIDSSLNVGDIVIGSSLVQHDMDPRPIFPRHEIPRLGKAFFDTSEIHTQKLKQAAKDFLEKDFETSISKQDCKEFGIKAPKVIFGEIASGDLFFSQQRSIDKLKERLPNVTCVEMEGAAVAQVCYEHGIPFSILRVISDSANEHAPLDFPKFVNAIASHYSHGILKRLLLSS